MPSNVGDVVWGILGTAMGELFIAPPSGEYESTSLLIASVFSSGEFLICGILVEGPLRLELDVVSD